MARLPELPHVKYAKRAKKVYAYFNTGLKANGRPVYKRLPDPGAPDFYDSYGAFKAARSRRQTVEYTVARLASDYMDSPDYIAKAKGTRDLYAIQLTKARKLIGKVPVDSLTPAIVQLVLDGEQWAAGTHNAFISALSALYTWGRKRGKTSATPTKDIEKREGGTHEPWPADVLEAALVSDNDRVRLAVHLLFCTGQRIGDVCALRWSDIAGGKLTISQQKRGRNVSFGLPEMLLAELARTPKRGITILTNRIGAPVQVKAIRNELIAFGASHGVKLVPHGLRKNAVNTLLEAGCSHAQVAAVTGQSMGMIEHYAKRVDAGKLGTAAMLKFDATRQKIV